jgi:hypothetical protein
MERKPPIRLFKCCVQLILEDVPGGGTVAKADFKSSSLIMKEGSLLSADTDGIYHLTKTARLWTGAASGDTSLKIYKEHEFKASDILINSLKTGTSRTILSVDESSFSYDILALDQPLNIALVPGAVLIEVTESEKSGDNALLKYPPVAVSILEAPISLQKANTGCGLLVRGRVKEELLPYPIDDSLKVMLPLIRFV